MTVQELITLLQNRIAFGQSQRIAAVQRGDIAQVQALDTDIASSQATLDQLLTLV